MDELCTFAETNAIDLTVVGPEAPLVAGIADRFAARGLRIFGPSQLAAELEGSKGYAKELMGRHGIPTARFRTFTGASAARAYCQEIGAPLVVKADGLASGKGVIMCGSPAEADRAITMCMEQRAFGSAGRMIVVEELLEGEEVSVFALSNGSDVLPMGVAQDHKRVLDDDQGPNTGGMGAYSPTPMLGDDGLATIMDTIVWPTVQALAAEGRPYRGVVYAGLMLTKEGPKVIEFNCRFGDPECQVLMRRLEDDLLPMLEAAATGAPLPAAPRWRAGASVCVVATPVGYPGPGRTGDAITGLDEAEGTGDVVVFHAGTARRDGAVVTSGGRVLGVSAVGPDIPSAIDLAYAAMGRVRFEGIHFRRDIGRRALRSIPGSRA
jgi:phosphoribosylamine--glycine ligase